MLAASTQAAKLKFGGGGFLSAVTQALPVDVSAITENLDVATLASGDLGAIADSAGLGDVADLGLAAQGLGADALAGNLGGGALTGDVLSLAGDVAATAGAADLAANLTDSAGLAEAGIATL